MGVPARLVVALAGCVAAVACAKTQARTVPSVALVTPAPPARVAVPVPLPEPEAPPATPVPTPEPATRPREAPPPRTERPAAAAPAPAAPAPAADAPTVLQTTGDATAFEQRTRTLLDEAQRNLDRVKRETLGASARAQYDSAESFIRSAHQALRIRNYLYAEYLATKAAAVARELVKG